MGQTTSAPVVPGVSSVANNARKRANSAVVNMTGASTVGLPIATAYGSNVKSGQGGGRRRKTRSRKASRKNRSRNRK